MTLTGDRGSLQSGLNGRDGKCECFYDTTPQYGPGEGPGEPIDYVEPTPDTGTTDPEQTTEPEAPPADDSGSNEITGNAFLDYWYS